MEAKEKEVKIALDDLIHDTKNVDLVVNKAICFIESQSQQIEKLKANVVTDNTKVNHNLLKEVERLKKESDIHFGMYKTQRNKVEKLTKERDELKVKSKNKEYYRKRALKNKELLQGSIKENTKLKERIKELESLLDIERNHKANDNIF